jgi:hypothetical protein
MAATRNRFPAHARFSGMALRQQAFLHLQGLTNSGIERFNMAHSFSPFEVPN